MNQPQYKNAQRAYRHEKGRPHTGGRAAKKLRIVETGEILTREAASKRFNRQPCEVTKAIIKDAEIGGVHLEYVE